MRRTHAYVGQGKFIGPPVALIAPPRANNYVPPSGSGLQVEGASDTIQSEDGGDLAPE